MMSLFFPELESLCVTEPQDGSAVQIILTSLVGLYVLILVMGKYGVSHSTLMPVIKLSDVHK